MVYMCQVIVTRLDADVDETVETDVQEVSSHV
jgi:hypothetical protein